MRCHYLNKDLRPLPTRCSASIVVWVWNHSPKADPRIRPIILKLWEKTDGSGLLPYHVYGKSNARSQLQPFQLDSEMDKEVKLQKIKGRDTRHYGKTVRAGPKNNDISSISCL